MSNGSSSGSGCRLSTGNLSGGPWPDDETLRPVWRIVLSVVPICMTALTIVGNVFVILVICLHKRLSRNRTSILILNLALADLLVGGGVMPLAVVQILTDNRWMFSRLTCQVWTSLDVICCTASIFTLCIISVDRLIAVTRPLTYGYTVTPKRLYVAVVLVWLLSLGVLLATFRWDRDRDEHGSPALCQVGNELQYVYSSTIMSFLIPFVIILLVYYKIYRVIRRRQRSLLYGTSASSVRSGGYGGGGGANSNANADAKTANVRIRPVRKVAMQTNQLITVFRSDDLASSNDRLAPPTSNAGCVQRSSFDSGYVPLRVHYGGQSSDVNKSKKAYQKQKKTAQTLALVVGAFLLSWLPFFILYAANDLCKYDCIPGALLEALTWLGYSNSALNPIIYAASIKTYGNTMRWALRRVMSYSISQLDTSKSQLFDERESRFSNSNHLGARAAIGVRHTVAQHRSCGGRAETRTASTADVKHLLPPKYSDVTIAGDGDCDGGGGGGGGGGDDDDDDNHNDRRRRGWLNGLILVNESIDQDRRPRPSIGGVFRYRQSLTDGSSPSCSSSSPSSSSSVSDLKPTANGDVGGGGVRGGVLVQNDFSRRSCPTFAH